MSKIEISKFEEIFSFENLLLAWHEFKRGKEKKSDVAEFAMRLTYNILELHRDIIRDFYEHGGYKYFKVRDPKERDIHKASIRDRIVHRALYMALYPYFDRYFVYDSYSCRVGKGTHRALGRFEQFGKIVSCGNTKTVWVLKCDIRKCFASVDHNILKNILRTYIECPKLYKVISGVVDSFELVINKGIPLGNLTSQVFINIYLHEFDFYVKRVLKERFYIRYADDFVFFDTDKDKLVELILRVEDFLKERLRLTLHPDKVFIKSLASGVDFLGWVHFHKHRVLRTKTKRRMLRKLSSEPSEPVRASYFGLLKHGNTYKLQKMLGFKE
jgi:hypothetical protein